MTDSAGVIAYRNSRPAKRMGAGAVLRDSRGRVLLVEPTYKSSWEVPGGVVEANESPRTACARELLEELGLKVALGRLLVMEWQGPEADRSESLMFLYDGGLCSLDQLALAQDELKSCAFVDPQDLDTYLVPRLSRRVRAGLTARAEGRLVEMEHGVVVVGSREG